MTRGKELQTPNNTKLIRDIAEILLNSGPIKRDNVIEVTMDGDPSATASNVVIMDKALEETKIAVENLNDIELNAWKLSALLTNIKLCFNNAVEPQIYWTERFDPPRFRLPFLILSPRKLYNLAEKLGIKTGQVSPTTRKYNLGTSAFSEEPCQIIWNGKIIPIEFSSRQHYTCRLAYEKRVGEAISWDEVADLIDGNRKKDLITNEKSIYNAVRIINRKVKEQVKSPLFTWEKHSFYRVA